MIVVPTSIVVRGVVGSGGGGRWEFGDTLDTFTRDDGRTVSGERRKSG